MEIFKLLTLVREKKPLIHHITNWVTIYDCANIVKVFGASPVMAHAKEEVANMTTLASALVLNIGTLTPRLVESMKIAANAANQKGIPVVLDVCGAGATKLRDEKAFELIQNTKINIIKSLVKTSLTKIRIMPLLAFMFLGQESMVMFLRNCMI